MRIRNYSQEDYLTSSYTPNRMVLGLELVASEDLLAKYSKLEVAMIDGSKVEPHRTRKHPKDIPSTSKFLRMILSGEIAKSIIVSANEQHQLDDNTSVSSTSISQVFKELDMKEPAARSTSSELEEVKALHVMPSFLSPIHRFLCADNNCNVLDLTTDNNNDNDVVNNRVTPHDESINNTAPDEQAVNPTETNLLKSFTTTLKWEELGRFMSIPINDSNVVSSMLHNDTTNNQSNTNTTVVPTEIIINNNTDSNESDLNLNKDDLPLSKNVDDVTEPDLLMTTSQHNLTCKPNYQDNTKDDCSLVLSTQEDSVPPPSDDMSMIKSPQSIESDQSTRCNLYEDVIDKRTSKEKTKPALTFHEMMKKKTMSVVGVVLRFVTRKRRKIPIKTDNNTIPEERTSDSRILVDDGQTTGCDRSIETIDIVERTSSVSPNNLVDDGQKSVYHEFLALFDKSDNAEYHDKVEYHENDVCSTVLNLNDHLSDDADMVTEKSRSVDDGCSTVSPASVERFPSTSPVMIDDHSMGSNLLPYSTAMVDTDEVYDNYHCVQHTSKLTAGDRVAKVFLRMRSGGYEVTDRARETQDDMDGTLESIHLTHKSCSSQTSESSIFSITCSTISSIKCATLSSPPSQNHHVTNTTAAIPSVVKCLTTSRNLQARYDTNPSVTVSKHGRRCVSFAEMDDIAHYGTNEDEATLVTHESLASNNFLSLLEKFANDIMDKTCTCEAEVEEEDDNISYDSTLSYDDSHHNEEYLTRTKQI